MFLSVFTDFPLFEFDLDFAQFYLTCLCYKNTKLDSQSTTNYYVCFLDKYELTTLIRLHYIYYHCSQITITSIYSTMYEQYTEKKILTIICNIENGHNINLLPRPIN